MVNNLIETYPKMCFCYCIQNYVQVFGADSSQEEVFEATTKHLVSKCTFYATNIYSTALHGLLFLTLSTLQVENVLNGYNATVFAYGATGR